MAGKDKNTEKGMELFEKAEECFSARDYDGSLKYYKRAAKLGEVRSMAHLGYQYRFGLGTKVKTKEALKWYNKYYKESKDERALGDIASVYYYGEAKGMKDKKLISYLVSGAVAGNKTAYIPLAECYLDGNHCEVNSLLAAYWAYRAYDDGQTDSAYYLARLFESGMFFPLVPAHARFFYEKARDARVSVGEDVGDIDEALKSPALSGVRAREPMLDYFDFTRAYSEYAEMTNPDISYRLALGYVSGRNEAGKKVKLDPKRAEACLKDGILLSHAGCDRLYAELLRPMGKNKPVIDKKQGRVTHLRDDLEGFTFHLSRAAEHGDRDALKLIVREYEDGVLNDGEKAKFYNAIYMMLHGRSIEAAEKADDGNNPSPARDIKPEAKAEKPEPVAVEAPRAEEKERAPEPITVPTPERRVGGERVARLSISSGIHYEGEVKNGVPHGRGRYQDDGWGIVYDGEMTEGRITGKGSMRYGDGSVREGYFEDGLLSGNGSLYDPTKRLRVEGDFVEGWITGVSAWYYDGGVRFYGVHNKGVRAGLGVRIDASGAATCGYFDQNGSMTYKYINDKSTHREVRYPGGEWHDCEWATMREGAREIVVPHGYGEHRSRSGNAYIGRFEYGYLRWGAKFTRSPRGGILEYGTFITNQYGESELKGDGELLFILDNGSMAYYKGALLGGKYQGEGYYRAPDGSRCRAVFKDNVPESLIEAWDSAGRPVSRSQYINFLQRLTVIRLGRGR